MKKLLSVFLVLAMASSASAYYMRFDVKDVDKQDSYAPSDYITIVLETDDPAIILLAIEAIVDDDDFGTAHDPLALNAGFESFDDPGYIVNTGRVGAQPNILIEYIFAATSVTPIPLVGGEAIIYSFVYHVPDKPFSTVVTIDDWGDDDFWLLSEVINAQDYTYGDVPWADQLIEGTQIHIVPEPMTIALLGLGGLFLRRRK